MRLVAASRGWNGLGLILERPSGFSASKLQVRGMFRSCGLRVELAAAGLLAVAASSSEAATWPRVRAGAALDAVSPRCKRATPAWWRADKLARWRSWLAG